MPKFFVVSIFFILCFSAAINGQESKTLQATRITEPPTIDGVLTDPVWETIAPSGDFYMLEPSNSGLAREAYASAVKMAYDDKAIYIAAYLYDEDPSSIPSQFSQRDNLNVQADVFTIALNTYNDGINETRFYVTSAGTIADSRVSSGRQDFQFDVVFQCRISKDEKGWYAEFKIPYNALRFPESEIQDWSINFYRRLVKQNETHTWNYINRKIGRETQYNGEVLGVRDIDPPVRLTFFPFGQASVSASDGETATEFSGGLDIKYGLSDSFTLDAQLIPDFGQVAFDAVRLNLGPFEQTFGENRAFFTEGVALFNKGGIFFSRRIGNGPTGSVGDLEATETLTTLPEKIQLLNSIKISGRTKSNLGIGVLNSITQQSFATIRDTITTVVREVEVEPLTNYNVFVLDQQFNSNSSISVINTNVIRSGSGFRDSNVTALAFDVANNANSYRTSGRAVVSNVNMENGLMTGFRSEIDFFKTKGKFRYRLGHDLANKTYDINDLGLNNTNNFNSFVAGASYEIFEPTKVFNKYEYRLTVRHRRLYDPNVHTRTSYDLNTFFVLPSRLAFGINGDYNTKENDYFEPRADGRFVIYEPRTGIGGFLSTDYRNKFAFDVNFNGRTWNDEFDQMAYSIRFSPRYRFSDKILLILSSSYSDRSSNYGWVDADERDIFFGLRDITSIENSINLSYNFDPFKAINLRLRNFWSTADYSDNQYFTLLDNGRLNPLTNYDTDVNRDPNTNFNIWNFDLSFRWRFAPGSEASLLYRNQVFNVDDLSTLNYTDSLGNLFDQPIQHTVSLRITYFIDYNNVKGIFNKA